MKKLTLLLLAITVLCSNANAQDVQNSRRMSQHMQITRTVGVSDITIDYHSPLAKGRKIFGGIVPYDFVVDGKEYPWRAGSNNRTTITFEHDVTINGNKLPAGKYGLVVLVSEAEWIFIFSSNTSWGAFQYTSDNDVLRITAKTEKRPFQEYLTYSFIDPEAEATTIELRWADTSSKFRVALDVSAHIISNLTSQEERSAGDYRILAIEHLQKDPNAIGLAMTYLDSARSNVDLEEERMKQYETFAITILRADLLIKQGNLKEGRKLKKQTLKDSQGFNLYYYGLNTLLVKEDKEEAFRLLDENIRNNPDQWQAYLAMGEYYLHDGNQQKVVENFKRSFELAPDNWKNYARYLYLQNKLVLDQQ